MTACNTQSQPLKCTPSHLSHLKLSTAKWYHITSSLREERSEDLLRPWNNLAPTVIETLICTALSQISLVSLVHAVWNNIVRLFRERGFFVLLWPRLSVSSAPTDRNAYAVPALGKRPKMKWRVNFFLRKSFSDPARFSLPPRPTQLLLLLPLLQRHWPGELSLA